MSAADMLPLALPGKRLTPAYSDEWATIYFGRAEEVLSTFPTESFDLVVTDPPYGVEQRSNHRAERFSPIEGDTQADRGAVAGVLRECVRLVGQNRHLYVFGPSDVLTDLKVSETADLVWDKTVMSGGDLSAPFGKSHEPITFAVSKHRHGGQAGKASLPARMRKGTVLRFGRQTGRKVRHPSEKPVDLLCELIESSSRQEEVILDPYAGVCSTGVAATLLGRHSVLVECDPQYVDLGIGRLQRAALLRRQMTEVGL